MKRLSRLFPILLYLGTLQAGTNKTDWIIIDYPDTGTPGEEVEITLNIKGSEIKEPAELRVDLHSLTDGKRKTNHGRMKPLVLAPGEDVTHQTTFKVPSNVQTILYVTYVMPKGKTNWSDKLMATSAHTKVTDANPQPTPTPAAKTEAASTGTSALTVPFGVRKGLPNIAKKLQSKEAITVAFLGGSITKADGAKNGFVTEIPDWLENTYGLSTVEGINAGINGTDSGFGAMRVDRDVIVVEPDLVFVEFVVNDGTRKRVKDMEIIVRKIWSKDPETDIVFLYTLSQDHLADWQAGKLPESATAHEIVADFYGIPSIALGTGIVEAMNKGSEWNALMKDGAHPNAAGYELYNQQIIAALGEALSVGKAGRTLQAETIIENLVLYPPAQEVDPLPEPQPVINEAGQAAKITYALPAAGKYWRNEPDYAVDGKNLWSLYVQPWKKGDVRIGGKINDSFSLSREAWKPMRWLEGANHFDGPEGVPLWKGNILTAKENDLPVIVFIAPETGTYTFELTAESVRLWSHHKSLGLNVVYFPWGATEGESIAFFKTDKEEKKVPELRFEQKLTAGEQVAFALNSDVFYGGGGAMLKDLSIHVGYTP